MKVRHIYETSAAYVRACQATEGSVLASDARARRDMHVYEKCRVIHPAANAEQFAMVRRRGSPAASSMCALPDDVVLEILSHLPSADRPAFVKSVLAVVVVEGLPVLSRMDCRISWWSALQAVRRRMCVQALATPPQ